MKVVIVDYGVGNLRSIQKRLEMLKIASHISGKHQDIETADRLILPGVGHFKKAMSNLVESGLIPTLEKKVLQDKTPLLGVCVGMQMLFEYSEEGDVAGLGWVKGKVKHFPNNPELRIPHVGWNQVFQKRPSKILQDIPDKSRFYFTHSYYVPWDANDQGLGQTPYGLDVMSVIEAPPIYGTQFHPEKSHYQGLKIFENFVRTI